MYMDSINYKKDFVFMTDKSGNLTGGGFNIKSKLLERTINGDGINQNAAEHARGGGLAGPGGLGRQGVPPRKLGSAAPFLGGHASAQ